MDIPSWWPSKKPYIIGDCLEGMKVIPDGSVPLILTDPPYGMTDIEWDSPPDWRMVMLQFSRILSTTGSIAIFGRQPMLYDVYHNAKPYFDLRFEIIWVKDHPAPWSSDKKPLQAHENIFVFSRTGTPVSQLTFNVKDITIDERPSRRWGHERKHRKVHRPGHTHDVDVLAQRNKDYKLPQTVIFHSIIHPSHGQEYTGHPTQKPLKLIEWFMRGLSNPGDVVLDPYLGSGTTLAVSRNLGRIGLGFEISSEYQATILNRSRADIQDIEQIGVRN